ncbi:MAG: hypothetical protein V3U90_04780 [Dehalococcoidia bacterium]
MVTATAMEAFVNWLDRGVIAELVSDEFEEVHGRPPSLEEMKETWLNSLSTLYLLIRESISDC